MLLKKLLEDDMVNMTAQFEYTGKKKVLIIDDDEDILNWFRTLQKQETPYTFFFLQDELEILKMIQELNPDLIFIDVHLNHINGKKLSEIIRLTSLYSVPIVHMSTKELSGQELSPNAFMRKPLERKAVDTKIRKLLKIL